MLQQLSLQVVRRHCLLEARAPKPCLCCCLLPSQLWVSPLQAAFQVKDGCIHAQAKAKSVVNKSCLGNVSSWALVSSVLAIGKRAGEGGCEHIQCVL